MKIPKLPRIRILYSHDPSMVDLAACYFNRLAARTRIDGKMIIPDEKLCSYRNIYISQNLIIKIEPSIATRSQTARESEVLDMLEPEDRKYFPKTYAIDKKRRIVFQEYLDLHEPKKIKQAHTKIIDYLMDKYSISDIGENYRNWAVNRATGLPVIYDFGVTRGKKKRKKKLDACV